MRIYLDTAPLIYLIEGQEVLANKVAEQLKNWVLNDATIGTSTLTLLELLVVPKKDKNESLVQKYRAMLSELLSEPLIPMSEAIAERAAEYRASLLVKTPDAVQLATATYGGFDVFYTNDQQLKKCEEIEVLLIE
ncbi:MAG: type II toxin-antitoxin system VapC family toxin [Planctomycetes bacterium]|nr:type II toxin-antitoxin system VapC family toxin [Planctomycetota bacterium]